MVLLKELFEEALKRNRKTAGDSERKSRKPQRNKYGFYRVSKVRSARCHKGFMWKYVMQKDLHRTVISAVSLRRLKEKVESKGLPWVVTDQDLAWESVVNVDGCVDDVDVVL